MAKFGSLSRAGGNSAERLGDREMGSYGFSAASSLAICPLIVSMSDRSFPKATRLSGSSRTSGSVKLRPDFIPDRNLPNLDALKKHFVPQRSIQAGRFKFGRKAFESGPHTSLIALKLFVQTPEPVGV